MPVALRQAQDDIAMPVSVAASETVHSLTLRVATSTQPSYPPTVFSDGTEVVRPPVSGHWHRIVTTLRPAFLAGPDNRDVAELPLAQRCPLPPARSYSVCMSKKWSPEGRKSSSKDNVGNFTPACFGCQVKARVRARWDR